MTIGADFSKVLEAAQRGDEQAIALLYRDVNPRLVGFLSARVPGAGEDLAADVWLAVAKSLRAFQGDESAWIGYLFTIARRQAASYWRRDHRQRTSPAPPESFVDQPTTEDPESEVLQEADTHGVIALVLEHLSSDQADVVLLRVVAGLDLEVVAKIVGKSPGNVRVIQHRALKRLASVLAPERVTT